MIQPMKMIFFLFNFNREIIDEFQLNFVIFDLETDPFIQKCRKWLEEK